MKRKCLGHCSEDCLLVYKENTRKKHVCHNGILYNGCINPDMEYHCLWWQKKPSLNHFTFFCCVLLGIKNCRQYQLTINMVPFLEGKWWFSAWIASGFVNATPYFVIHVTPVSIWISLGIAEFQSCGFWRSWAYHGIWDTESYDIWIYLDCLDVSNRNIQNHAIQGKWCVQPWNLLLMR